MRSVVRKLGPQDAVLWNRLGATLANSGKPELAIDAYYKALKLNPHFVRARYNLGIRCVSGPSVSAGSHVAFLLIKPPPGALRNGYIAPVAWRWRRSRRPPSTS